MFGVSRSSLRQALKVLEIMGVIRQQVSRGTYLEETASAILSEPLDFLILLDGLSHHELFETRMILEPEMAARAAERATTEDIEAIREALARMKQAASNQAEFIEADVSFHKAVAQAAGNRVTQRLLQSLHRAMLTSIARTSGLTKLENSLSFHRPIYAAIRRRSPVEARKSMVEHFVYGRDILLRAGRSAPQSLAEKIQALRDSENGPGSS